MGEGSVSKCSVPPTMSSRPIHSPTAVNSAEEKKCLPAVLCVNEHIYRKQSRSQVLELKNIFIFNKLKGEQI